MIGLRLFRAPNGTIGWLLAQTAWMCCAGFAVAQVSEITDPAQLSEHAVSLEFGGERRVDVALAGAPAATVFKRWGVTFRGAPSSPPLIKAWDRNCGSNPPNFISFLRNNSPGEDMNDPGKAQAAQPLIVDFEVPLKAVLFHPPAYLCFGASHMVFLEAFDPQGTSLGTVEHDGFSGPVGLETSSPLGISKVVFDYRDSTPEEFEAITIDYLEGERIFTTYLAQIGAGTVTSENSEDLTLSTSFIVSNPAGVPAKGQISFFDNDGQPIVLSLDGSSASAFDLSLDPLESKLLSMDDLPSSVMLGYAIVSANTPLDSLAIFSVYDSSGLELSNADVEATTGVFSAVASAQKVTNGRLDSGLAIVNTSQKEATIELKGNGIWAWLTLGPGKHAAQFLAELFPELLDQDYQGTLHIVSDQPLAVVVLRTRAGLPVSAVPVSSLQK